MIFIKPNNQEKENVTCLKTKDPLRSWCEQFLDEYSKNESVDKSIENIPSYKPTKTQLTKFQKQRENDLLQWSNQF